MLSTLDIDVLYAVALVNKTIALLPQQCCAAAVTALLLSQHYQQEANTTIMCE